MTYGACAIDGRYRRMDGRAFGFSGEGKGLNFAVSFFASGCVVVVEVGIRGRVG